MVESADGAMTTFKLPNLDEGLAEAEIREWHVKPGDKVTVDQSLLAVETDKTVADIPSHQAGKVESSGRTQRQQAGGGGPAAVGFRATPPVRALARQKGLDLSMVTPSGTDGMITAADVERVAGILAEVGPMEPLRGPRRAMARSMPEEMRGHAFILSNYGAFGGKYSDPIVLPPAVAISARGAAARRWCPGTASRASAACCPCR